MSPFSWLAIAALLVAACGGEVSKGDGSNTGCQGERCTAGGGPGGNSACTGSGCPDGGGSRPGAGPDPVGGPVFDDDVADSQAFMLWELEVQPLIEAQCGSCHLGKRFAFVSLQKAGDTFTEDETVANYEAFFPMISLDNPPLSRLLTKLLPASDPASQQHGDGGAAVLSGTDDPTYRTLLAWIEAEKGRRCEHCGTTAERAFIGYVDQPDTHWAMDRSPHRDDYGQRNGAKIMMQPIDPATGAPLAGEPPVEFLPASFCGPQGECDFGPMAVSHAGDKLVFECRLSLEGGNWVELSWNLCIAEIGPDGRAQNPRFVRPASERHHGWIVARSDPYMIADANGLPVNGVYDKHARMRKENDALPIFSPDDSRIFTSSRSANPRTGLRASTTYHGFEFVNNIVSMDLAGGDLRTVYLSEGGTAEHMTLLRNGNLAVHTWNLERMDRHLYTQVTQDGMMELPVFVGANQGTNMWGNIAQLPGGAVIGITGRRRGAVEHFQAFFADHTLGTGLDTSYTSFKVLDPDIEAEFDPDIGSCSTPPDGRNCHSERYYNDASYTPYDGVLIAHHPVRTYYAETGVNDNLFQDRYGGRGNFGALQPYLPELRIASIDRNGTVRELIQPEADRSLRYPVWVGRRQAPVLQPTKTDETQSSAELHIADVPIWFSMSETGEQNQSGLIRGLDAIVALRVLVKVLEENDCLNDALGPSTYRGGHGGNVDHPTHLGINNATGYLHLKAPESLGGDAFGNVPLKADRSVWLRLPAGKLLLLQGVDAQGHMVAQHTRLFTLPPGQTLDTSVRRQHYDSQCMPCHGSIGGSAYRGLTSLGQAPAIMDFDTEAKAGGPIDLTDASVQQQELTFLRALRPVLEAKCVSCHSGATPAGELTLEARYSDTANYPAGRWAQEPHVLNGYLNSVPVANRVPGYNWSVARIAVLERDQQRQAFIPTSDPYKPQGELAPWDPAYQTLMLSDTSTADRFYFLSDHPYATQVGRGGRWSNTSYLLEVLTGRDLAMKTYTGMDHTSMLDQAEIRMLMALIDNGMPFMARCSDTTVPTGPNAGKPWGDPVARGLP